MAGSSAPRRGTESAPSVAPRRKPGRWRALGSRLAGGSLELVAVLALTLAFFGSFLTLMGVMFPAGESLRDLALLGRSGADVAAVSARGAGGDRAGDALSADEQAIASLDVLRPDVKHRSAETIAWDPVRQGQPLRDQDAVQTGADGRALVRFDAGNELHVEHNSLIVVTRLHPVPAPAVATPEHRAPEAPAGGSNGADDRRRGLVLMEGELLARLQAPDRTALELSLPNIVARLADTTSGAPAKFRVQVRKDHSATVSVLDGRLNLESHSGVVSIGPRQFSRVTPEGDVSPPRALPSAPAECVPAAGSAFAHLDTPPRVTFAWKAVAGATQYRLRAARDADFRDVVLDETVPADTLTWGRAKPDRYWWQVSALVDDVEGMPTAPRTLVVRRDAAPPRLAVQSPPRIVHDPRVVLRGEADPRARVFVMGRRAELGGDGTFHIELELQPGANVVVVEAVDAAGLTSYWSQVVHVKP